MAKGRGVLLQRYRDAKLADITTFKIADGLVLASAGGECAPRPTCARWLGKRGQAGHTVPRGFNRFEL